MVHIDREFYCSNCNHTLDYSVPSAFSRNLRNLVCFNNKCKEYNKTQGLIDMLIQRP